MPPRLPEPPPIRLTVVKERESDMSGFVNVRRLDLRATYADGTESSAFAYDVVTRRALDAVVICAVYTDNGEPFVYLRSAVRPPLALRPAELGGHDGALWELPAGLVEAGETPEEAAARETEEELGFAVLPKDVERLGRSLAPAPALIGELHHFVLCRVAPEKRREPTLDGSPLEHGGAVVALSVADALALVRAGRFADEKTELALRRLGDALLPAGLRDEPDEARAQ